jgi:hypothetical protein
MFKPFLEVAQQVSIKVPALFFERLNMLQSEVQLVMQVTVIND